MSAANWGALRPKARQPGDPSSAMYMTLRDYFAAKAMAELITYTSLQSADVVAEGAYKYADAMLKARDA